MKTFAAIAALAISATARLTERGDDTKCCFTLTAHGGTSGSVGQLGDGQTRVGGGYPPSHFCLTNGGGITDGNDRGCILTRESHLLADISYYYCTNTDQLLPLSCSVTWELLRQKASRSIRKAN